ncbi:MAG TPA: coproporphyrinogen-III oxidase family protein [Gemmatales bacterium]|nr:coproporphyrinogen-III oxidase family protein [Gemmatales bacterium]HMP61343.1 coproporphyrinogen-III oxidase family protein [Gemmatales bacterium]
MPATALPLSMSASQQEATGLGNYFIANYPPFAHWKLEYLHEARAALAAPPRPGVKLGLYLHIPFCRKRCKFCYFRVYTDKNARDVESYLDALLREVELYAALPAVAERPLDFVYFGGGTPSYLSAQQLALLFEGVKSRMRWEQPREITFECEPGTLQREKLVALYEHGVTRLSLGVENFDDRILEENGRAHRSPEIDRAYGWAKELGFAQINVDLIAGMVGETWDNWRNCVRRTIALEPDSVTIYQMELPFNTLYSKDYATSGVNPGIADWPTKRAWVAYAYDEFAKAGYEVSSGYTVVRRKDATGFVYRDELWHGADLLGTGVASFGHVSGVHVQNVDQWDDYLSLLERGELPWQRALKLRPEDAFIRELILQLKTGRLDVAYFAGKFQVDILARFAAVWDALRQEGYLEAQPGAVVLTRQGVFEVDRLLPRFFLPEHVGPRYV